MQKPTRPCSDLNLTDAGLTYLTTEPPVMISILSVHLPWEKTLTLNYIAMVTLQLLGKMP